MERKKRSKGRGCESCYVKKIYDTFGVEMRAYGQKLVQFCKHTHTHTYARVHIWANTGVVFRELYCGVHDISYTFPVQTGGIFYFPGIDTR